MADVVNLSAKAKMATKVFVRRLLAIFATNAAFLRVGANLKIQVRIICNMYHVIVHFLPKKALFLPKDLQKVRKSRQILIHDKIVYVWA